MTVRQQTWEKTAQTIIKGLERRNMTGEYCPTAADALAAAKKFLVPGSSVSWGGSTTLSEIGLMDAIHASSCTLWDRHSTNDPEALREIYRQILFCDTYFMSTNAITLDGVLVNIDGNANRASALTFGPSKVVLVVGMNKVAPDVPSAVQRAQKIAAPINATRLGLQTPCTATGTCANCQSPDCICCQVVVTRRSRTPNRIHVILVGEALGY